MQKSLVVVLLLFAVLGCVQPGQEERSVVVNGVEYQLSNGVELAKGVPVYFPPTIRDRVLNSRNISVIFDCTAQEDRPLIAVAAYNAVSTIQNYLVYNYQTYSIFDTYCFVGGQWYNSTNAEIERPVLAGLSLWFRGPLSGGNETVVYLSHNNTIVISGTDYGNLTLATDAFVLSFLGERDR